MTLRFTEGDNIVESRPLAAGVYDVQTAGGTSVLAVNPSRELYPRRAIRPVRWAAAARSPTRRGCVSLGWVYAIVIICAVRGVAPAARLGCGIRGNEANVRPQLLNPCRAGRVLGAIATVAPSRLAHKPLPRNAQQPRSCSRLWLRFSPLL